ncbi:HNH endonuclease [Pseudomonas sp. RL_5y_Pfl2_69]|uniref:HNH endonuclease n=1 Tax=Pseudomonas sp. RL_5y_Pfl2_69 TaxID=3088711 RepID=UPI0030DABE31
MSIDAESLAGYISAEIGLEFTGIGGRNGEGNRYFELLPAGHPAGQTFALRLIVGWRSVEIQFRLGTFAGELLNAMGAADFVRREAFCAVLRVCHEAGAEVIFTLNNVTSDPRDDSTWCVPWRSLSLIIKKGMLNINEGDSESDMVHFRLWTARSLAAIFALLPLEVEEDEGEVSDFDGFPEGGKTRIEVNAYERDRRNRAVALAIHGFSCKACNLDLGEIYGPAAAGLIEVHHVVPVSMIGTGYIINPQKDLLPLCPNCHAVTHRRTPPYSLDEVKEMLR